MHVCRIRLVELQHTGVRSHGKATSGCRDGRRSHRGRHSGCARRCDSLGLQLALNLEPQICVSHRCIRRTGDAPDAETALHANGGTHFAAACCHISLRMVTVLSACLFCTGWLAGTGVAAHSAAMFVCSVCEDHRKHSVDRIMLSDGVRHWRKADRGIQTL